MDHRGLKCIVSQLFTPKIGHEEDASRIYHRIIATIIAAIIAARSMFAEDGVGVVLRLQFVDELRKV